MILRFHSCVTGREAPALTEIGSLKKKEREADFQKRIVQFLICGVEITRTPMWKKYLVDCRE